ncbi:MAG: hypothetical protein WC867_00760 [Candidatus Pacearchaeota archaeon]|jgi:hypothetical protein
MDDIFDNTILCKNCNIKMNNTNVHKNGFILRAVNCPECNSILIHPKDEHEFNDFVNLKNKEFSVKMRYIGNSYAVSIPRELVNFIREQEKIMDDMVSMCLEDFGKISLNFANNKNGIINKGSVDEINEFNQINKKNN